MADIFRRFASGCATKDEAAAADRTEKFAVGDSVAEAMGCHSTLRLLGGSHGQTALRNVHLRSGQRLREAHVEGRSRRTFS